jgi:hypothetical protein
MILFLVACTMVCATEQWISLDRNDVQAPTSIQVKILNSTPYSVQLEITVNGYSIRKMKALGQDVIAVYIPGCAMIMQKGAPELPKFAKLIQIASSNGVELIVNQKEEIDRELEYPIIPSKGHLTRDINPADVPDEFGPIYEEDAFWPAADKQFSIGDPFLFRDIRGVRLNVFPMSVNHVQKTLRVLKKAVVTIKSTSDESINEAQQTRNTQAPTKTFQKMYEDAFVNYKEAQYNTRAGVPAEGKKLVVVCPNEFENAIADWITWKKKCGYTVDLYTFTGKTASEIKAVLQEKYNTVGFSYVVLIGDASYASNFEQATPMPSFKGGNEGAASDRIYVRLAGNDNYPDAFISRISANTADEIKAQLAKIIRYEQMSGGAWVKKGMGVAGRDYGGGYYDYQRAEWLQVGGSTGQKVTVVDGGLMGAGYNYFYDVYPTSGGGIGTTKENVAMAVNEGIGIGYYIGHGSNTSWGTTGFNNNDVKALNNGDMMPVIWSVACVNGNFLKVGECFAEAWLRKTDGGAAGMEASSTNEEWVPPCDKQAATINAIITKKYATFGALECEGAVTAMVSWGDTTASSGNRMMEQCHLFGDCTMIVKTGKSTRAEVSQYRNGDALCFNVYPTNATVTVYNADMSFVATADANEAGDVEISLISAPEEQLYYTIVGQDIDAVVDELVN